MDQLNLHARQYANSSCKFLLVPQESVKSSDMKVAIPKMGSTCPDCNIVFKTKQQLKLHSQQYPNRSCKFFLVPEDYARPSGMKVPIAKEHQSMRPIQSKPAPIKSMPKAKTTIRVNAKDFESIKPCSVNLEKIDGAASPKRPTETPKKQAEPKKKTLTAKLMQLKTGQKLVSPGAEDVLKGDLGQKLLGPPDGSAEEFASSLKKNESKGSHGKVGDVTFLEGELVEIEMTGLGENAMNLMCTMAEAKEFGYIKETIEMEEDTEIKAEVKEEVEDEMNEHNTSLRSEALNISHDGEHIDMPMDLGEGTGDVQSQRESPVILYQTDTGITGETINVNQVLGTASVVEQNGQSVVEGAQTSAQGVDIVTQALNQVYGTQEMEAVDGTGEIADQSAQPAQDTLVIHVTEQGAIISDSLGQAVQYVTTNIEQPTEGIAHGTVVLNGAFENVGSAELGNDSEEAQPSEGHPGLGEAMETSGEFNLNG